MFAIMRCKKLKSMGNAAASFKHNFREQETLNADPEMTPDNEHRLSKSTSEAMGALRERLPEKRRKDAVIGVEYLLTASPEWFKEASRAEQDEFFNRSLTWLADKYGKENIVSASIHRDETTPHMSAVVVPMTADGRLSAKEMIGNQQVMKNDQTAFAKRVEGLGLQRGIEGSKAKHQTIQNYYRKLNTALTPLTVTEDAVKPAKAFLGLGGESYADVAERLTEAFTDRMQAYKVKAVAYDEATKRIDQLEMGVRTLRGSHEAEIGSLNIAHNTELETALKDLRTVTGLRSIPDEDKEHFLKRIKGYSDKQVLAIYDKYHMDANAYFKKEDGEISDSSKCMCAMNVINALYKRPYFEDGKARQIDELIASAGTFPIPKDTPEAVMMKNPFHAERLKLESDKRKADLENRRSQSTGGIGM